MTFPLLYPYNLQPVQWHCICTVSGVRQNWGKTEKQKSLCEEVISQNSLLFMEKKPSKGGCMLPEGQPSTEDWFILNNTGVRVSGLLS